MRSIGKTVRTSAVLVLLLLPSGRAAAQSVASAGVRDSRRAAELVSQSLALLERGEDAADETRKMGAYAEGERLALEALELDAASADAHFALFANQGRRLMLQGAVNPFNLLKVNRSLDRCLELNPDHSDALAARGGMYRQLPTLLGGSLKNAERDLRRSIELDPQATGARIELARTYHDLGEDEKVVPLLREALFWAEMLNKPRRVREAKEFLAEVAGN
jgi:tetratricopeptide (TPR) repeat protein